MKVCGSAAQAVFSELKLPDPEIARVALSNCATHFAGCGWLDAGWGGCRPENRVSQELYC